MGTFYWIGGDSGNEGDFNQADNWFSPDDTGYPDADDDVIIFGPKAGTDGRGYRPYRR